MPTSTIHHATIKVIRHFTQRLFTIILQYKTSLLPLSPLSKHYNNFIVTAKRSRLVPNTLANGSSRPRWSVTHRQPLPPRLPCSKWWWTNDWQRLTSVIQSFCHSVSCIKLPVCRVVWVEFFTGCDYLQVINASCWRRVKVGAAAGWPAIVCAFDVLPSDCRQDCKARRFYLFLYRPE